MYSGRRGRGGGGSEVRHERRATASTAATNGGRAITPRLPLSPNAIRNKRFQPQGRRGYERADVDLFISQVAADVQLWIDEVTRQRAEIERLKNWIRSAALPRQRQRPDPDMRISAEAVGVLARAQHHADLVVATAHDQARAIVGDADAQAQAIVEAARMEADRAAQAYRATAGMAYSPEGEDLRRRLAILQTFLGTLTAVQAQLPAVRASSAASSPPSATRWSACATWSPATGTVLRPTSHLAGIRDSAMSPRPSTAPRARDRWSCSTGRPACSSTATAASPSGSSRWTNGPHWRAGCG